MSDMNFESKERKGTENEVSWLVIGVLQGTDSVENRAWEWKEGGSVEHGEGGSGNRRRCSARCDDYTAGGRRRPTPTL